MLTDLRHGVRTLAQAKGWTIVVVASLALGIGASMALFGAANGVLLRTVNVPDPDTLVRFKWEGRNDAITNGSDYGFSGTGTGGSRVRATFAYAMFRELAADGQVLRDLAACAPYDRLNVVVDGRSDLATALIASGNYFTMLGAPMRLGRPFTADDDRPAAEPVAVISYRFWRARFNGDASVIGKPVRVNDVPITIVGVLAPEFTGIQTPMQPPPDVTVPLSLDYRLSRGDRLDRPMSWWLQMMGRTKPGVAPAAVRARLEPVFQRAARRDMQVDLASLSDEERMTAANRNRREVPQLRVEPGRRGIYEPNPGDVLALRILGGVVALMLLMVCANVANLLLSRAVARHREMSVRLSLGATRGRLIRQLLTESLLLAVAGAALGLLVCAWGRDLLPGVLSAPSPVDWRMLAFVIGLTGVTAVVFGTAPALRATRIGVDAALKEHSRSVAASGGHLQRGLLVFQVGLSLVLLVGAGLFLRTVENLRGVDVGFNPRNLVLFRVSPELNGYDETRIRGLYDDLLARIEALPGVRAAGLSYPPLLAGSRNMTNFFVQGRRYAPEQRDDIYRVVVSPGFFAMMEIPVLSGRVLVSGDASSAPKVAVINTAMARTFFPDQNPIGLRIGYSPEKAGDIEIVGIVADAKYDSLRDAAPPTVYVPYAQMPLVSGSFLVRTAGDPRGLVGAIRETVRAADPELPIADLSTQMEEVEQRFAQERLFASAYALFGGVALLLAAIGLFGLMSYGVARRTNEIGIRMALGARQYDVLRLVLAEALLLVGIGIGLGLAAAAGASRLVASQLFGVAPTDAVSLAAATTVLFLVALAASYLPARRASRIDPMAALREP